MRLYFKILILLLLYLVSCMHAGSPIIVWGCSFMEFFFIIFSSLWLISINRVIGYVVHVLLYLMFSLQFLINYFSGDFLSVLMIENIGSVDNLGSDIVLYIGVGGLTVLIALIPVAAPLSLRRWLRRAALISAGIYIIILFAFFPYRTQALTPLSSLTTTVSAFFKQHRFFQGHMINLNEVRDGFRRDSVETGFHGFASIAPHANIIIIFTEGLSAEVLDVYNKLGLDLTPNLNRLHSVSLSFDNYFNHTAATFRGLRGQLYSGYQYPGGNNKGFAEMDEEQIKAKTSISLCSLVDVLEGYGYHSYFVNPEPEKLPMVRYLESLGFDSVLPVTGNRMLTDRETFEELSKCIHAAQEPFVIGVYNVGTHHGWDSPDVKYGDGSNSVLNRFHNYDAQFGEWFERMKQEGVFERTLLVFTTDHASFHSPEWKSSFKSEQNAFIARIPLFMYGAGITFGKIDAEGRNSLDLTPTLLDMLQMNDCENWFLGNSLFVQASPYSRCSAIGDEFYTTTGNVVRRMDNGTDSMVLGGGKKILPNFSK